MNVFISIMLKQGLHDKLVILTTCFNLLDDYCDNIHTVHDTLNTICIEKTYFLKSQKHSLKKTFPYYYMDGSDICYGFQLYIMLPEIVI